jgi:transcriptional regulator with XRE-family HTH domain
MGREKSPVRRSAFGQRLHDARKKAGLTLDQAAEKLGMVKSSLWEAEKTGESLKKLIEACTLYGVSPVWLKTGDGPMEGSGTDYKKLQAFSDWLMGIENPAIREGVLDHAWIAAQQLHAALTGQAPAPEPIEPPPPSPPPSTEVGKRQRRPAHRAKPQASPSARADQRPR